MITKLKNQTGPSIFILTNLGFKPLDMKPYLPEIFLPRFAQRIYVIYVIIQISIFTILLFCSATLVILPGKEQGLLLIL